MSVAWTTIAIMALLLPGIFFFIGLATRERLSREIIRSGVVSEVAMAIMVAVALHTSALSALSATGFRLSDFVAPLAEYGHVEPARFVASLSNRLLPAALYVMATAAIGFAIGCVVAAEVVAGPLRFLATHKWIYDVVDSDRKGGAVTAYVMTTMLQNNKALMYRGRLQEFYLDGDGRLSYITLKNCSRYYMDFTDGGPRPSEQLDLFGSRRPLRPKQSWDYLLIDGANVSNVLFDPSPQIKGIDEGAAALEAALAELEQLLTKRSPV